MFQSKIKLFVVTLLALFASDFADAQDLRWRQIGPEGGSITALAVNPSTPQTVYAGTRGGSVYKSINGGGTWNAASTGLPSQQINRLVIDPTAPQTVYAATSEYIYKSEDGGSNWSRSGSSNTDPYNVIILEMDPANPKMLYASTGLFYSRSTDGGATWTTHQSEPLGVSAMAIDPTDSQILYACQYISQGLVYKSLDGGSNWMPPDTHIPSSFWNVGKAIRLIVDPTAHETVYAASPTGVFLTLNGGYTWLRRSYLWGVSALLMDPTAPKTLFAGTEQEGIFKTTDGGDTWNPANEGLSNLEVFSLAIDPLAPQTIYAGTSGGVFKSTNGGSNWNPVNSGMHSAFIYAMAVDPTEVETLYGVVLDVGLFKSVDGGNSWDLASKQLSAAYKIAIDPSEPQILYALSTNEKILKSTNGGRDWIAANSGIEGVVWDIALDPTAPSTIYAASYSKGMYKSTNGGADWLEINTGMSDRPQIIAMDPTDPHIIYVGTAGNQIFKSTDAGSSWLTIGSLPSDITMIDSLAIIPWEPRIIYAGARAKNGSSYIFLSTDGGVSWIPVGTNLGIANAIEIDASSQTVYAGTGGSGVFKSAIGGTTWSRMNTALGSLTIGDLKLVSTDPLILYAGTSGGIWAYSAIQLSEITIDANPMGQSITVDGASYNAPRTFSWEVGSSHTIAVATLQESDGTRYLFKNWSDGGKASHTITVPADATTYTANLTTQYQLTATVSPLYGGRILAIPASADGYYSSLTSVQLSATANNGFSFSGWGGNLTGSNNIKIIIISSPRNVTANFSRNRRPTRNPFPFPRRPRPNRLPVDGRD